MYQIYDLGKENQWLKALKLFPSLDIFFLPAYYRAFEEEGDGRAKLFFYEENGEYVIYPFFLRCINDLPYFKDKLAQVFYDIISPYGYAGPVATSGSPGFISRFRNTFDRYCQEINVVTEFVRFHPFLENHCYPWDKLLVVEKAKPIVALDLTRSYAEIWADYQYNNKKNIKKARRKGLQVVIEEDPGRFPVFQNIYQQTMKRREAQAYYYFSENFFESIHRSLKGNFVYAYVLQGTEIVSAELLLFENKFMHSFLGGTLENYFFNRPNNLLKHEVIQWGKAKGFQYYVLGGGYEENDGIFRYKQSFTVSGIRYFYIGKKIHNREAMIYLENAREFSNPVSGNTDFFPSYRRR